MGNYHKNKHIDGVINDAVARGWRFVKATGGSAHTFGTLRCPHSQRDGCQVRIFSTPRNPERHARQVRDEVDRCPH